jgi:hypothetical protein
MHLEKPIKHMDERDNEEERIHEENIGDREIDDALEADPAFVPGVANVPPSILSDIEKRYELLEAGRINRVMAIQQASNFGALSNRTTIQAYRWALEELRFALAHTDAIGGGESSLGIKQHNFIFEEGGDDGHQRAELKNLYLRSARAMTNFVEKLYIPQNDSSNQTKKDS